MPSRSFEVPNISCGHCVKTIGREIREIDGVVSVEGDEKTRRVTVDWQEPPADWDQIRKVLQEIGYPPAE